MDGEDERSSGHRRFPEAGEMSIYEIRVKGHLDQSWSSWFDGLIISYDGQDQTVLCGPLTDEAALHGVLIKVRDLALPLLALRREDVDGPVQGETATEDTGEHDIWLP